MASQQVCDVAIIGGGPSGLTAAWALADAGRSVVLIAGAASFRNKPGEGLAPEVRPLLDRLGLLPALAAGVGVGRPCLGIRAVWGAPTRRYRDFAFEPHGNGWLIDRVAFEERLLQRALVAGAEVRRGATAIDVASDGTGWVVRTEPSDEALRAAFLVDASGRAAVVARRLGSHRELGPPLFGVVAVSRICPPAASAAAWIDIEAVRSGWWYRAEGPTGLCHEVFFGDASAVRAQLALSDSAKSCEAPRRERKRLSRADVWAASSGRSHPVAGEGWLAVGDAAATFDPLAAQGLPNALASGLNGAIAVHGALQGQRWATKPYEEAVSRTFDLHRRLLAQQYALERRFAGSRFWDGRGQAVRGVARIGGS